MLLDDHLFLGQVTHHNSSLNQFVAYEVRCLM
jgi:hypothetical protein